MTVSDKQCFDMVASVMGDPACKIAVPATARSYLEKEQKFTFEGPHIIWSNLNNDGLNNN